MMDAVGRPRGLVRYASENGIAEGNKLRYTGRMKFYTIILVVLTGLLSALLLSRKDIDGTIVRTRGQLYQERGTDSISNLYNIKIINKTIKNIPVTLKLEGDFGKTGHVQLIGSENILLKEEDQASGSFFIVLPKNVIDKRKLRLKIGLYEGDKKVTTISTNFMGPFSKL